MSNTVEIEKKISEKVTPKQKAEELYNGQYVIMMDYLEEIQTGLAAIESAVCVCDQLIGQKFNDLPVDPLAERMLDYYEYLGFWKEVKRHLYAM